MEWAGPSPTCGELNIGRDILGARSSSPIPGPIAQGSSARKISPYNFWLQKPEGIDLEKLLEPQAVPLKEPTHRLTYSDSLPELQHQGNSLKSTREKLRCLASR